jgi:hypothetical protein
MFVRSCLVRTKNQASQKTNSASFVKKDRTTTRRKRTARYVVKIASNATARDLTRVSSAMIRLIWTRISSVLLVLGRSISPKMTANARTALASALTATMVNLAINVSH